MKFKIEKKIGKGSLLPPQPQGPLHNKTPPFIFGQLGGRFFFFCCCLFSQKDKKEKYHAKQA